MSLFALGSCMMLVLLYLTKIADYIDSRELAYRQDHDTGLAVVISVHSDEPNTHSILGNTVV